MKNRKKIVFLTGTRADFGKIKSLVTILDESKKFDAHIFATGMHMLEKYGSTVHEIFRQGFKNVYMFNNSAFATGMDISLSNTINGFSNYIRELKPQMIIVHGDRPEALAGAIVGAFNNILVAHIEGGEISGTVDELVRHSISKLAHIHFVTNGESERRLLQMGEKQTSIYKIGSPEVDLMLSKNLPDIEDVKKYYGIDFNNYSILIYHPVTTEIDLLKQNIKNVIDAVINSNKNYIVIAPNNDSGSDIISKELDKIRKNKKFKFYPSLRFEYFLVLLKHCNFIIGNSSSGVREATVYGIPSINIGSRQKNRSKCKSIFNVSEDKNEIIDKINYIVDNKIHYKGVENFGDGKSTERFFNILSDEFVWTTEIQKIFNEIK